jgi:nucleotide-binding universal stress UspA family protein
MKSLCAADVLGATHLNQSGGGRYRRLSAVGKALLGSVTQTVVLEAKLPILVARSTA